MTEQLEDLQKENDELPAELLSHEQRGALLSISELLDNLQDKDIQSNGASNLVSILHECCLPELIFFGNLI